LVFFYQHGYYQKIARSKGKIFKKKGGVAVLFKKKPGKTPGFGKEKKAFA
jgi:hypothetical protein